MNASKGLFLNTKIWITFFIILFMVLGACLWSYNSYQKLEKSIFQLSEPDNKSVLIQNTILGISKSENYIKSYILTDKPELYNSYLDEVKEIQKNIDDLKNEMAEDSLMVQKVDSLEILFLQKLKFLNAFMKAKKNQQRRNYSNEALEKITNTTKDSTAVKSQINANLITIEEMKPTIKKNIVASEYKSPGIWEGIKRMFGTKNLSIDTVYSLQSDTVKSVKVSLDTVTFTNYNPDTILTKVKEILEEVANAELVSQYIMSARESSLLKQDMILHNEIYKIMDQIQKSELNNASFRRYESYKIIKKSTLAVLTIGLAGIIIGGFFLIAIARDLSRSYYLSRRLEKEKNKANQLGKIKEEFLANMSHEIRTPLNGILGYSEQIHKTNLDHEQKIYAQAISENTKLLMGLVNDVLDFSKLNFNKIKLTKEPFYFRDISQHMDSLFAMQCSKKGIELRISYDADLDEIDLIGDEFRIKQILINLLGNALKFTEKGYIQLSVKSKKVYDLINLDIKVCDTGKGIHPSKFAHIFKSFEQEESTITKKYGGTGLGLSIVKSLTDAMKGKISVESKMNELTTFRLQLSLPFQQHIEAKKEIDSDSKQKEYYDINIVVIEDDPWNAALIKTILTPRVKALATFDKPKKALKSIESEHEQIDLILTDINMPGISGIDILNKVKSIDSKIPVIAITAHVLPEKLQSFIEMGFDAIITKPYNELAIMNALNDLFGNSENSIPYKNKTTADQDDKFDFEKIKQFVGDDHNTLMEVVQELISGNVTNITEFGQHLHEENRQGLADISHKMIQTYDSLNLIYITESLQNIEVYFTLGHFDNMMDLAREIHPRLKKISEKLMQVKHQSYT